MKECTKCHRVLPESEFGKNIRTKDRLQIWCKECRKEYYAIPEVKQKRKEYTRKYRNRLGMKQKRHEEYEKYFAKPGVRQKHLEQQKKYAARPEAKQIKKENTKRYCAKPEVKQRIRKNAKRYRVKPESQQKIKKYYSRSDVKQRYAGHARHRRLKKKQLFENFTLKEWTRRVDVTDGICPVCNRRYVDVYPYVPTLDHTPPISKAPINYTYTIDDVTPMCGSCNSSKSTSF